MTAEKVVGAQYVVTENTWGQAKVGTVVTLEFDDGSNMPRFTLPNGRTQWIPMGSVVKLIVDGDEPVATADTLDFDGLEKDVVYKDSDGDYVLLVSKPVNGVDLFVADSTITRIVDYWEADELNDGGYSKATEGDTEQVMQLFKQYVLENQKHISEAEVAELQEGDKITIVDYLYHGEDFGVYCSRYMPENAGKEFTVNSVSNATRIGVKGDVWEYSYDMIASVEKAVNQVTPKYAVGDIVVFTGGGIFSSDDWEVARRITAVDLDKREYVTEWADGTLGWRASVRTFEEVDHQSSWKQFTGEIPASKATEQPHITAEQFAAIKVGDKLKLRTDLDTQDVYGECWSNGQMVELAVKGITPKVTRIDNDGTVMAEAEDDYWFYTAAMIAEVIPAEPEFNCPEIEVGQAYVATTVHTWEEGKSWLCRYYPYSGEASTGNNHEVFGGPSLSSSGNFYGTGYLRVAKWRKATAEETAKLEAAEKEHGYVPPLVNKIGTVIEADKYYVLTGVSGTECICKVVDIAPKLGSFYKNPALVELTGSHTVVTDLAYTDIDSPYGRTAVPATPEQIALYDAAVALHEAAQALEEAA